jgi:hypothetical protein
MEIACRPLLAVPVIDLILVIVMESKAAPSMDGLGITFLVKMWIASFANGTGNLSSQVKCLRSTVPRMA